MGNVNLLISIPDQILNLLENGVIVKRYRVSTARNGPGEQRNSGCTPRGWHVIRAKIGRDLPCNTVFVGRRPTGEVYDAELAEKNPDRDWILTRILWLGGLEPGINRYHEVDTAWRYIYIHGSPDHGVTGRPQSHGCIRMTSVDMMDLFDRVRPGTRVLIVE
ncbi:MAG: L,D-transpeptidase family protein [Candidatus Methylumidiphilus sp.]